MKREPILHALGAALYIVLIVNVLNSLSMFMEGEDGPFAPVLGLSLFVLSAGVMAFLFCYRPLSLYIDGQKKEAMTFFLQTLGTFAVFTALMLFLVLYTG